MLYAIYFAYALHAIHILDPSAQGSACHQHCEFESGVLHWSRLHKTAYNFIEFEAQSAPNDDTDVAVKRRDCELHIKPEMLARSSKVPG